MQGFVSQSRRTRDVWGSSYLLAFLSAHAMHGAAQAGGSIVQPDVADDRLYLWVSGIPTSEPPRIGTVPNHFVVEVRADARHLAEAAVGSLDAAWLRVCDAVWARFVEPACLAGNETQAIWDRQVGSFWEVSWTSGPWSDSGNLLARRKQWRSHSPPDEPGDKCTVMHDLQELSGHVRARHARQQDEFWRRVNRHLGELRRRRRGGADNPGHQAMAERLHAHLPVQVEAHDVDLERRCCPAYGTSERLCAVALVKRLFPKKLRTGRRRFMSAPCPGYNA